jgi:ribose 5-phosphate isomerase B
VFAELELEVRDCGVGDESPADYRAAACYDRVSARSSREHNDANVLALGGRLLTPAQAEEVLRTWLATPFAGGRHSARLRKITEIEKRYSH